MKRLTKEHVCTTHGHGLDMGLTEGGERVGVDGGGEGEKKQE